MNDRVKRVLEAYMGGYTEPLKKRMYPDMQQQTYPDQEQSYTDLKNLDTQHGGLTHKERYKFEYPGEWTNPDWAGGNFLAPYEEKIIDPFKTPNTTESLYANSEVEIEDLGSREAFAMDSLLAPKEDFVKVSSMDLTNFMKISDDTLIHKSRNDLWKMFQDKSGNVFIKRLFDEDLITD